MSQTSPRPPTGGLRFCLAVAGGAGAVGFYLALAYAPAFGNFFFDDELLYLAVARRAASPLYALTTFVQGFPRPVVHLYFAGLSRVFGATPAGYYVAGAGLFLLNVVLFAFVAARVMGGRRWGLLAAAVAGAAFYPYETVYCLAAGATGLLCGIFFLAAFLAYFRYVRRPGAASFALLAAAVVFAHASKESSASLVPMLALYEAIFGRRRRPGRWRVFIPLAAITGAYVALDVFLQISRADAPNLLKYTFGGHALANLSQGVFYLLAAALPPVVGGVAPLKVFVWATAWAAAFVFLRRRRALVFAFLWLVVTFAPFIFWRVDVARAMPRYLFLPAFGFALFAAAAAREVAARLGRRRLALALIVAVLAVFVYMNGRYIRTLAPRYLEPGAKMRLGVAEIQKYRRLSKPFYLWRYDGVVPWYREAVNTVFFDDELILVDTVPPRAAAGARLLFSSGAETVLLEYNGGRWEVRE